MKVRYHPVVWIVPLMLGGACLFLGLWLTALGEFSPALIPGLFTTLIGVLYLARPYFWLNETSVQLVALVGPHGRKFPFQTLEIDGARLFAVNDGDRKKVPVARWMAHPGDWAAAVERDG